MREVLAGTVALAAAMASWSYHCSLVHNVHGHEVTVLATII